MRRAGLKSALVAFAALSALAACDPAGVKVSPVPSARPEQPPPPPPTRSQTSRELEAYYARIQQSLLTQGLLRRDGGGPDTPFNQRQLVDNFVRIALYEEFSSVGGRLVARQTESRLHRWERPVRIRIRFGDTISKAQQAKDRANIVSYAARLARVTGHPISIAGSAVNMHVFIVNEDERRVIGPQLRQIVPGLDQSAVDAVQNMARSTFCLAFARDAANNGAYTEAVVVIRGEHPDLLRLSCIHEEIAQALGVSNDSPSARPSIFNDDEEFGLLTTHDEMLLRMLYDARMRPGMTVSEARPVAETIAAELLGGES